MRIYPDGARHFDVLTVYNRPAVARSFQPRWIGPRAFVCADANIHHRDWDKTCADTTIRDDRHVTALLLDWVRSNQCKVANDGRSTYLSGSHSSAEGGVHRTTPDLTIAPRG